MRLINTTTLVLHKFVNHKSAPAYAILSHCWGEGEVSFKDFSKRRNCSGPGYQKIVDACAYARQFAYKSYDDGPMHEGFDWLWVDTCCIDKRSSSELSEAINSMFAWYQNALCCFAYLADIDIRGPGLWKALANSRWFRRGWTLQELIAPSQVIFLDLGWNLVGVRCMRRIPHTDDEVHILDHTIESITGVPAELLRKGPSRREGLQAYSVAQRMSWASHRSTTRIGDEAYALLGLFEINMPLLYGEGKKAFVRLQHEILRHQLGESIFAWGTTPDGDFFRSELFSDSPRKFAESGNIVESRRMSGPVFSSRGNGVALKVPSPPQDVVYVRKGERESFLLRLMNVRLACGRLTTQGQKLVFTPCVMHLETGRFMGHDMYRVPNGYNGTYTFEDEVQSPESWLPLEKPGTWYIRPGDHSLRLPDALEFGGALQPDQKLVRNHRMGLGSISQEAMTALQDEHAV